MFVTTTVETEACAMVKDGEHNAQNNSEEGLQLSEEKRAGRRIPYNKME